MHYISDVTFLESVGSTVRSHRERKGWSRRELAAASGGGPEARGYLPADWKHPMPIETVDWQKDLFGDGRLTLVPLPGHTPGSLGALVNLDRDGSFLLASDAMPLRENYEREAVPRNTWNAVQAMATLREIRRIEADGATVVFGHDAAQYDALRKGAASYG